MRDSLEHALIHQPGVATFDFLNQMLEVPLQERYRRLDVKTLLQGGLQVPRLRSLITALNILEKYGKNLLSPLRPKFWRSIKFNNPVFKERVDAIENTHPHQEKAEQELLGGNLPQQSYVTDCIDVHQGSPSEAVLVGCFHCGKPVISVFCSSCNESLCIECDKRIHSHPNHSQHQRSSCDTTATNRPMLQGSHSPVSSRPPWHCASCHILNRGGSVLCVGCDRPRGCASGLSSLSPEIPFQKDTWECRSCTLQNTSSAVLCAVCDRPRLASKPSRDSVESSSTSLGESQDCFFDSVVKPFARRESEESDVLSREMATITGKENIKSASFPKRDIREIAPCEKNSNESVAFSVRDRLADSIGPLTNSTEKGESCVRKEGWQCSHCTFYNIRNERVCEVCERTSEETPATEGLKTQDMSHDKLHNQEMTRQKQLREDGAKIVAMIREGERNGVTPEEVCSAVQYSGTEVPEWWLQTELPCVLDRLIDTASKKSGTELGALTHEEARSAWVLSGGKMDDAVILCMTERRSKVETLCALGFQDRDAVVAALYESAGDVGRALCILQRPLLEPFLIRMWEETQPPLQLDSTDRHAVLRRLLAEHSLHSWGRAELALSLLQESEGRYDLQDVLEAVRESQDRDFIKRMLSQQCAVCAWELPRNKMRSLTSCECCICPDCFRTHFTVAVKEKHIRDMICPACEEPEISDEGELLHYFSTLDILLRDTLEEDAYNLFHKKLTERTLMKDPKFLWCTHCSFGFIYERDQLDVKCPQCECSFCRNCKRPWEEQHRFLSCEAFQNWKRENDAEYQAQGLAVYLQENGITCPHCKYSYALARGGCMHFICSQCRHQFCSGCYNTFHPKNKCTVPNCTVKMSLHAHHPRDCLFYLRDWEVIRLQRLLQMSQVQFNTDPPAGTQAGPGGGCRVMEQKETLDGLRDEACGKVTTPGYAGLCESHYKEYLVSRINDLSLDPCALYDLGEAINVCQRYLPLLPPQNVREDEASYRERLLKVLISEVPLSQNIPRKQHS
ncbi:E3 ubiquitin-protein ligase RNF31 isoform 1-T1 [Rhinophrynus dorsalis]